jgi:VWFA-related protein
MRIRSIKLSLTVTALCFLSSSSHAQQPQPTPPPEPKDTDVVRISVRLVQVDGTVTDKQGHPVSDLTKEDFQLFVDGQLKPITTFYYVPPTANVRTAREKSGNNRNLKPEPPTISRLREDRVRRIIVLVVANVSADALRDVKKAMNRFVDDQMQPGDLVSVIRPSEGVGVLQQFTSDKRLLHLAINGVRWNPLGHVGVSAVPDPENAESTDPDAAAATRRENAFYEDVLSSSWLRSLDLIVRGLQDLPGRKSVILFSNGFQLFGRDRQNRRVIDALHMVTDRATRGLVVFHTVDARGLQPLNISASVNTDPPPAIGTPLKSGTDSHKPPPEGPGARVINFVREQDGLVMLAEQTGGAFAGFNTDISKILGDQQGYYVLGYRPDEEPFKANPGERPFHQIKVKMMRSNLQAHFRKGFYGQPDKVSERTQDTNSRRLMAALLSPFDSSQVGVKLTSLFGNDRKDGSFVRSLMHVDLHNVTFNEDSEGRQVANLNIFAVAFDQSGPVGDLVRQRYVVRIKKERFDQARKDGLTYELTTPVQQNGLYQVRVIVQDASTEQMGSASQLVEVPDTANGRLTLTGLIVSARNANTSVAAAQSSNPETLPDLSLVMGAADPRPAVRRFRAGMEIGYAFLVLNSRLDPNTQTPKLTTQVIIYRDGSVIYTGTERALEPGKGVDTQRMVVSGQLNLGQLLVPGEYILQVTVTDSLAQDKKYQRSSRWMDFDVVE